MTYTQFTFWSIVLTLACFLRCTLELKKKLQEDQLAQIRSNFLRRRLHQHAPPLHGQTDDEIDGKRESMHLRDFYIAWYCCKLTSSSWQGKELFEGMFIHLWSAFIGKMWHWFIKWYNSPSEITLVYCMLGNGFTLLTNITSTRWSQQGHFCSILWLLENMFIRSNLIKLVENINFICAKWTAKLKHFSKSVWLIG